MSNANESQQPKAVGTMAERQGHHQSRRLFRNPGGQADLLEKSYEEEVEARHGKAVECLGLTFENEEARRAHFLGRLRQGLEELHAKLGGVPFTSVEDAVAQMMAIETWPLGDEARLRNLVERMSHAERSRDLLQRWKDLVGFPHGEIEDIVNLSDPPYYTACLNPFLGDFVSTHATEHHPESPYSRHPFASDVTEGKGGKVYKAHTFHTKVPHEAIARYILHYTEPGDVVLDAFCGCGMTGVAAAFCSHPDDKFRNSVEKADQDVKWGRRYAVLLDLSPFATFLSHNMTFPWNPTAFSDEAQHLIGRVQNALYSDIYGDPEASYLIWAQTLRCPSCSAEFPFGETTVANDGSPSFSFKCPSCDVDLTKTQCENKHITSFDDLLGAAISQNEYRPMFVMKRGAKRFTTLDRSDIAALASANGFELDGIPIVKMMFKDNNWGEMYRTGYHFGITHVHHFWTRRALAIFSRLWAAAATCDHPNQMRFLVTSFLVKTGSRMHNVAINCGQINLAGQIFNTLQIPSVFAERNVFELARGKIDDVKHVFDPHKQNGDCVVLTGSAASINLRDNCVDYVFVDPPFGSNIMYAEMSFLYEAWLGSYTNDTEESIVSEKHGKTLSWYRDQMARCFSEIHRVLKPGRWVTVAFHNSRNEVWIALQEALQRSGFVVADVRILDKGQGTYKQMTTSGAVEKDLAITAYKPNGGLEARFELEKGTEAGVWDFVRTHLRQLPVCVVVAGRVEIVSERQPHLLFDRMVAFHVLRSVTVPLSAGEFYSGLAQRFPDRDGMVFLADQVTEYDKKRMAAKEIAQLEIFVVDESSAIQWLRQQLSRKSQTFQEIHPQFLREIAAWQKHEKLPELSEMLDQSFLCYDGSGEVPSQIHSYLSTNFKELRNLPKDHPALRAKAKDRWYVPDPKKAADVEKRRERALLREFEEYRQSPQKKLKLFRLEAMRVGFRRAWQDRDYKTIISVGERIPETVLQEDQMLLMWYDQALTRAAEPV